jgi:hypothetical protein
MAIENCATKRYFISRYAAIEEISNVAHFSIILLSSTPYKRKFLCLKSFVIPNDPATENLHATYHSTLMLLQISINYFLFQVTNPGGGVPGISEVASGTYMLLSLQCLDI